MSGQQFTVEKIQKTETYLLETTFSRERHSGCFKCSAMKTLLLIFAMLATNLFAATCDDSIARGMQGGTNPILLTLQPGVSQDVYWDFTQCTFGIQNFTVYVTQPRNKNGFQPSLKPGTPLQVETTNLTTSWDAVWPNFICYMGTVSSDHILCTVTLSANAKRPMDVEVSYSAGFGGTP
jgi:hypothetical protein